MTKRKVKFKEGSEILPCPKCGNKLEFTVHSNYCAEDCCEIWVVCKCGYDPTELKTGSRLEDVWGGCDDDNCINAIDLVWNEALSSEPTPVK